MAKRKRAATKTARQKPSTSLSDKLDRDLAARALRKVMNGETLSSVEKTALRRHEKEQEEKRRWSYYEAIPQKHWREMSGRQAKVLNEQSLTYGIPFGEAKINLPQVVRALHDFLAANARKLASRDDDDLYSPDVSSPALERYREERAKLAKLDRLERERTLVARDEIREGLGRIAAILRQAGDSLQRQFGEDAGAVLNEALDDADREVVQMVGEKDVAATTDSAEHK